MYRESGVCGKTARTAGLQDELTGALIGLARTCASNPKTENTDRLILEGLFATVTNVNFDDEAIERLIDKVRAEKEQIAPGCAVCEAKCGNTDEYDMKRIWEAQEDIRSLKSLILFGIRGMAAYAYHARYWAMWMRKSTPFSTRHYLYLQRTGEWKNFFRWLWRPEQ